MSDELTERGLAGKHRSRHGAAVRASRRLAAMSPEQRAAHDEKQRRDEREWRRRGSAERTLAHSLSKAHAPHDPKTARKLTRQAKRKAAWGKIKAKVKGFGQKVKKLFKREDFLAGNEVLIEMYDLLDEVDSLTEREAGTFTGKTTGTPKTHTPPKKGWDVSHPYLRYIQRRKAQRAAKRRG